MEIPAEERAHLPNSDSEKLSPAVEESSVSSALKMRYLLLLIIE